MAIDTAEQTDTDKQAKSIHSDYKTVAVELQFELLKQFAWLGSAIIGGIIVLLQLGKITLVTQVYVALACFALSIIVSVQGQDYLVSQLTEGKTLEHIASRMKTIRVVAFSLISFGIGMMIYQFVH